jgi:hypothetical protein
VFGPAIFDCIIEPRNEAVVSMIREKAEVDQPKDMEDSSIYDKLHAEM